MWQLVGVLNIIIVNNIGEFHVFYMSDNVELFWLLWAVC